MAQTCENTPRGNKMHLRSLCKSWKTSTFWQFTLEFTISRTHTHTHTHTSTHAYTHTRLNNNSQTETISGVKGVWSCKRSYAKMENNTVNTVKQAGSRRRPACLCTFTAANKQRQGWERRWELRDKNKTASENLERTERQKPKTGFREESGTKSMITWTLMNLNKPHTKSEKWATLIEKKLCLQSKIKSNVCPRLRLNQIFNKKRETSIPGFEVFIRRFRCDKECQLSAR